MKTPIPSSSQQFDTQAPPQARVKDPVMPSQPPAWIQAWRRFVTAFFNAEFFLARVMIQACKLRLRPRTWVAYQDPMWMEEKEQLIARATGPCQHDQLKRYGNRHGRYSKCLNCGKSWVWSEEQDQWVLPAKQKNKLPLPLPSSSTAVGYVDNRYTPAASMGLSLTSTTSMALTPSTEVKTPPPRGARAKSTAKRTNRSRASEDEMSETYEWDLVDAPPRE